MTDSPDILIIICDQLRWDALGCYGNSIIRTPNIDRLSRSATRFERAYCTTPLCVPARASLLSGLYPHLFGSALTPGMPTLSGAVRENGYHTAALGKMHFKNPPRGPYGFDLLRLSEDTAAGMFLDDFHRELAEKGLTEWHHGLNNYDLMWATSPLTKEEHVTTWNGDEAVRYLAEERPPDRPFFSVVSFVKPHPPFDPPDPYDRMYDPADMPPAENGEYLSTRCGTIRTWAEDFGFDVPCQPEWTARIRAAYYGLVTQIDDQVGRILDTLEEQGLYENTAIFFLADHGEMLGDQGMFMKHYPYDACLRIPFLLKLPGQQSADSCDAFVTQTDIAPTVCELTGTGPLPGARGQSLIQLLEGSVAPRPGHLSLCGDGSRYSWVALITPEWKYHYYVNGGEEELFRFRDCHQEGENLADSTEGQAVCSELKAIVTRWLQEREEDRDPGVHSFIRDGNLVQLPYERTSFASRERYLAHRSPCFVPGSDNR